MIVSTYLVRGRLSHMHTKWHPTYSQYKLIVVFFEVDIFENEDIVEQYARKWSRFMCKMNVGSGVNIELVSMKGEK